MPTQRLAFASALALLLLMAGPAAGEVKKAGSVKTGKKAPSKPYVIRLTDEQVRILRGIRKRRPLPPKAPKMEIRN